MNLLALLTKDKQKPKKIEEKENPIEVKDEEPQLSQEKRSERQDNDDTLVARRRRLSSVSLLARMTSASELQSGVLDDAKTESNVKFETKECPEKVDQFLEIFVALIDCSTSMRHSRMKKVRTYLNDIIPKTEYFMLYGMNHNVFKLVDLMTSKEYLNRKCGFWSYEKETDQTVKKLFFSKKFNFGNNLQQYIVENKINVSQVTDEEKKEITKKILSENCMNFHKNEMFDICKSFSWNLNNVPCVGGTRIENALSVIFNQLKLLLQRRNNEYKRADIYFMFFTDAEDRIGNINELKDSLNKLEKECATFDCSLHKEVRLILDDNIDLNKRRDCGNDLISLFGENMQESSDKTLEKDLIEMKGDHETQQSVTRENNNAIKEYNGCMVQCAQASQKIEQSEERVTSMQELRKESDSVVGKMMTELDTLRDEFNQLCKKKAASNEINNKEKREKIEAMTEKYEEMFDKIIDEKESNKKKMNDLKLEKESLMKQETILKQQCDKLNKLEANTQNQKRQAYHTNSHKEKTHSRWKSILKKIKTFLTDTVTSLRHISLKISKASKLGRTISKLLEKAEKADQDLEAIQKEINEKLDQLQTTLQDIQSKIDLQNAQSNNTD